MNDFARSLAQVFEGRFAKKQNELRRMPGEMGDGFGNLYPTGLDGFVYVLIGDKALPVFNNRVAAQYGTQVWVGYAPEEPNLFQVLSTRSEKPSGSNVSGLGYAPAKRYEWMAEGGGQDPLSVHLRAFSPLKLSMTDPASMSVNLYRGFVYTGSAYLAVSQQDIDLTSYIPSTADKTALVMISIDNTGMVVKTKGSEVDIDALVIADQPAIPADTVFVSGLVRVYNGQTAVREARVNTDIVDLRFYAGLAFAGGGGSSFSGQYRQFVWHKDGSGGWEFASAGDEPIFNLENLE